MSEMPEWAIERALVPFLSHHNTAAWSPSKIKEEMERPKGAAGFAATVLALAKMIAAYEEPPVDPLLKIAVEIATEHSGQPCLKNAYYSGERNHSAIVRATLAGIQRGMELERAK